MSTRIRHLFAKEGPPYQDSLISELFNTTNSNSENESTVLKNNAFSNTFQYLAEGGANNNNDNLLASFLHADFSSLLNLHSPATDVLTVPEPQKYELLDVTIQVDHNFEREWLHNRLITTDTGQYTHVDDYIEVYVAQLDRYLLTFSQYAQPKVIETVLARYWPVASKYLSATFQQSKKSIDIKIQSQYTQAKKLINELKAIIARDIETVPKVTGFNLTMQDVQTNSMPLNLSSMYNNIQFSDTLRAATLSLVSSQGSHIYSDAIDRAHLMLMGAVSGRYDSLKLRFIFHQIDIKMVLYSNRKLTFEIGWLMPSYLSIHEWVEFLREHFALIQQHIPETMATIIKRITDIFLAKRKFTGCNMSVIVRELTFNKKYNFQTIQFQFEYLMSIGLISTFCIDQNRRTPINGRVVGAEIPRSRLIHFQNQYHIFDLWSFIDGHSGTPDQRKIWMQVFTGRRFQITLIESFVFVKVENLPLDSIQLLYLPLKIARHIILKAQEDSTDKQIVSANSLKLMQLYYSDNIRFAKEYSTRCQYRKQPSVLAQQELSQLSEEEKARTITINSLVTGEPFVLICPKAYPIPNFITGNNGAAAVCCNREKPREATYRWSVQEHLRKHDYLTAADEERLALQYNHSSNQISHVLNFFKKFMVGRFYALDPRWSELAAVGKNRNSPHFICLVDDTVPTHLIPIKILEHFEYTQEDLTKFLYAQGRNILWSLYENYQNMPDISLILEYLRTGNIGINFSAFHMFLLAISYLILKQNLVCFILENNDHELSLNLQNRTVAAPIMLLDESKNQHCCVFVIRNNPHGIALMQWHITDQPNIRTAYTNTSEPIIKDIMIPMVSSFLAKQQTLTATGLANLGFDVLGIFYEPQENIFGTQVLWQKMLITVPCIPTGVDFRFEMLDVNTFEDGRQPITKILEYINVLNKHFVNLIQVYHISVLPGTNLPALLMTNVGIWLLAPHPYTGEITKIDNGLSTFYPQPARIITPMFPNSTISRVLFFRELKKATIYHIIEAARDYSDGEKRKEVRQALENAPISEQWDVLQALLEEPIDTVILQQIGRKLFDIDIFDHTNFTFDLDYLHKVVDNYALFKQMIRKHVIFVTEDDFENYIHLTTPGDIYKYPKLLVLESLVDDLFKNLAEEKAKKFAYFIGETITKPENFLPTGLRPQSFIQQTNFIMNHIVDTLTQSSFYEDHYGDD